MPEQRIKTIIADGDSTSGQLLKQMLQRCCPEIEIVSVCHTLENTVISIKEISLRLIFIETELPDGYCTNFYLVGKIKISSSHNLKFYSEFLPKATFMRVNHSFILNLNHVKGYNSQEEILLTENLSCLLSAAHKNQFMGYFKHKK